MGTTHPMDDGHDMDLLLVGLHFTLFKLSETLRSPELRLTSLLLCAHIYSSK